MEFPTVALAPVPVGKYINEGAKGSNYVRDTSLYLD